MIVHSPPLSRLFRDYGGQASELHSAVFRNVHVVRFGSFGQRKICPLALARRARRANLRSNKPVLTGPLAFRIYASADLRRRSVQMSTARTALEVAWPLHLPAPVASRAPGRASTAPERLAGVHTSGVLPAAGSAAPGASRLNQRWGRGVERLGCHSRLAHEVQPELVASAGA